MLKNMCSKRTCIGQATCTTYILYSKGMYLQLQLEAQQFPDSHLHLNGDGSRKQDMLIAVNITARPLINSLIEEQV